VIGQKRSQRVTKKKLIRSEKESNGKIFFLLCGPINLTFFWQGWRKKSYRSKKSRTPLQPWFKNI